MNNYTVLALCLCLSVVFCTNGVTVRTAIKDFTCFKQQRYIFAMVRGFLNVGKVDPNVRANLIAAEKAKLLYTDVFMNPCPQCELKPEDQVNMLLKEIAGTTFSTIYVVVQPKDKWGPDKDENCRYVNAMIDEINRHEFYGGVGSDIDDWKEVVGAGCMITSEKSGCWWDKHDKIAGFEHFKPFGGFTFPSVKEYDGPARICDTDVELNFCNC